VNFFVEMTNEFHRSNAGGLSMPVWRRVCLVPPHLNDEQIDTLACEIQRRSKAIVSTTELAALTEREGFEHGSD